MTQEITTADLRPPAILPPVPTREQIVHFEALLLAGLTDHSEIQLQTEHHHAEGIYGRAIKIPAGTVLTGAIHKAGHLNVCVGDITCWTEAGMQRFTGTHVIPSQAGAKRVGYAHADTLWLSVHRNDTGGDDLTTIENALVEAPQMLANRRAALPSAAQPAVLP